MQFTYPYHELFDDFNDPFYTDTERITLKNVIELDFVENMSTFLVESALAPKDAAIAIASSVFARMSDKQLHYHTPIHVLGIFQFHEKFVDEPLRLAEQLAIWFHDSIYNPMAQATHNEEDSAGFLNLMLRNFNRGIQAPRHLDILVAKSIILDTAQHLAMDNPACGRPNSKLVMDLDLSSFAGSYETFVRAGDLVRQEYPYISDDEFMAGRKKFLTNLQKKGYIFRSETFKKAYEDRALEHIEKFLAN